MILREMVGERDQTSSSPVKISEKRQSGKRGDLLRRAK